MGSVTVIGEGEAATQIEDQLVDIHEDSERIKIKKRERAILAPRTAATSSPGNEVRQPFLKAAALTSNKAP